MELKELKNEVLDALKDAVKESIANEERSACVTIDTNDGYIDIYLTRDYDVEVGVTHDIETNRTEDNDFYMCPNMCAILEKYIKHAINWSVIEEEFERESADEADNLRHYEQLIY